MLSSGRWTTGPGSGGSAEISAARFDITCILEQMSREPLGNFELMVMLAVVQAGDEAYGIPIASEMEAATGRKVLLGSVYAALDRLEAKGFVTSSLGDPT